MDFTGPVRAATLVVLSLTLWGCGVSAISPAARDFSVPDRWQQSESGDAVPVAWLPFFGEPELNTLVLEALVNNHQLGQQRASLEASRQNVVVTGADLFPEISLGLDGARRQSVTSEGVASIDEDYSVSADLSWELDIWGKLNAQRKQALFTYKAAAATYTDTRQRIAAETVSSWYQVIKEQSLLNLFEQRLENVKQNLDIIDRGYKRGINDALDLYLTQDTVAQASARVEAQRQALFQAVTQLELLLARYPGGNWLIDAEIPHFDSVVPAGIPSDLLKTRPDIETAWFNLLAADASLAVAHKRRFPQLRLTGSIGDSDSAVSRLLDGGAAAWSIVGGLTQPLFEGRRLSAQEKRERALVRQSEQRYLEVVFLALSEVENSLHNLKQLEARYVAAQTSEAAANAAYELSFEQYRRGLVTYTTVLESQRRAFDAQNNVIELRSQLVQERVTLYRALGGNALES